MEKFYTIESCPTNVLQNIFIDCTKNIPNLGVTIKTDGNNFNTFKSSENLDNIIPFLVERKFCYYSASSKEDSASINQNTSLYNLFDTNNILIKKEYNTDYQPDDIVKNNIVNIFSFLIASISSLVLILLSNSDNVDFVIIPLLI